MKDNLLLGLFAVASLVFFCMSLHSALNTPEVEFSWETKKCVRVVYMNGTITDCSVLPKKYDKVWVK